VRKVRNKKESDGKLISENNIIRKGISILLMIALIFTGLFSYPNTAYAESVVLSEETYYHLDMGIQITYAGDEWEDRGYDYGETLNNLSATIGFPTNIEVLDAYPLKSGKGSTFDFDGAYSSTNIPYALKSESGSAANAYNRFYEDYTSTSMTATGTPSGSGNKATFSYNVYLNTSETLDVVYYGKERMDNEIWKLFGGKDNVSNPLVKSAIENALLQGLNNTANGNKLYLVFCPTVIEYKKYITVGDLEAQLNLPSSAKQDENYTVSDESIVDISLTVDTAVLEKHYGDGNWELVDTWYGTTPGQNTGGSIGETEADLCTITYRLTVTTDNGLVDTDIKAINITDSRTVNATARLQLPQYN